MLASACRTRTARNRRVKDARRSVTGPFSAALPVPRDISGWAILIILFFAKVVFLTSCTPHHCTHTRHTPTYFPPLPESSSFFATLVIALKGVVEITPRFETAFVLACHYAISKLCQGMCHHYGARHVSPPPHVSTFTGFDHGHQCRCRECASSPTPTAAR